MYFPPPVLLEEADTVWRWHWCSRPALPTYREYLLVGVNICMLIYNYWFTEPFDHNCLGVWNSLTAQQLSTPGTGGLDRPGWRLWWCDAEMHLSVTKCECGWLPSTVMSPVHGERMVLDRMRGWESINNRALCAKLSDNRREASALLLLRMHRAPPLPPDRANCRVCQPLHSEMISISMG